MYKQKSAYALPSHGNSDQVYSTRLESFPVEQEVSIVIEQLVTVHRQDQVKGFCVCSSDYVLGILSLSLLMKQLL